MSKNLKNREKLMKIANIGREILHIFWTTWGNSMKVSGKMCFKIILSHKKPGLHPLFFRNPPGEGGQIGGSTQIKKKKTKDFEKFCMKRNINK